MYRSIQVQLLLVALLTLLPNSGRAASANGFASDSAAGANTVFIDAQDAYIPSEDASYWVVTDPSPSIPVRLDSPSNGLGTVDYVTLINPGIGMVGFEPTQSLAFAHLQFFPGPGEPILPGYEGKWAYFALTETGNGLVKGTPDVLYFALVTPTNPGRGEDQNCVTCAWGAVLCFLDMTCDYTCAALGERGSAIVTLQRYRDEVLAATADGQFYVDLYSRFSPDLFQAILAAPSLTARLFKAQGAWVEGLQALVDGQGDSFVITQQMEDDLLSLLQTFQDVGSPDLAAMISFERQRLELDQIAGLTMSQYQAQVENLGGPTSVDPTSWGRIKSLYR